MNISEKLSKNNLLFLWGTVFLIILLSTPVSCDSTNKNVEGFYTNYGYYKKYCPSVGWRSRHSCSKCTNGGWCITPSGYGECVPGDSSGPYFRDDCMYYEYGDPYYYYPHSNIYPVVKTKSIYPYYRYDMRRPYRWRNKLGGQRRNLRINRNNSSNSRNIKN